jgi:hypothetical protein
MSRLVLLSALILLVAAPPTLSQTPMHTVTMPDTLKFDAGTGQAIPAGGFASMPATHPHYGWTTEETLVQVHGVSPTDILFVNPADDPRKK